MTEKRQLSHQIGGGDGLEPLESTITVYEKADIPESLTNSVEGILLDTLGLFLDGTEISWWIDENGNYVMTLISGFPEIPVSGDNGELIGWKAPYQGQEKFLEGDNGLMKNLHGNWGYEIKNQSSILFYPDKY